MGWIVSIEQSKGGVGKTTTTVNLGAGLYFIENKSVQFIDRDNVNHSLGDFFAEKKPDWMEVLSAAKNTNYKIFMSVAEKKDITLIDGPANDEDMGNSIRAAHTFIIPVAPSRMDLSAMTRMFPLIMERLAVNDNAYPKAGFLVTMDEPGTLLSKRIASVLCEYPFPVFESRISDSQIYKQSMGLGYSVFEMQKSKAVIKARSEFVNLINELKDKGFLNG